MVAEASVVESVETLLFIVLIESFKNDFDVVDEINDGMELMIAFVVEVDVWCLSEVDSLLFVIVSVE